MEHRLATDDEEFPIGFSEDPYQWAEDAEYEEWFDPIEDDYEEDGLFDPMEAEKP